MNGTLERIGWHASLAVRASRLSLPLAFAAGLLLRLVLPVEDAWLAGSVAIGVALAAVVLMASGRSPRPASTDAEAAVESLSTREQVGQALARAAFVLGAFAIGLAVSGMLGLDRA